DEAGHPQVGVERYRSRVHPPCAQAHDEVHRDDHRDDGAHEQQHELHRVLSGGLLPGEEIHGKIPGMEAPITLRVNGKVCKVDGDALLLDELRGTLGLKGSRFGCGMEQCGACLVLVDGNPAYACTLPASAASNKAVTTVEGLGTPAAP